MKGIQAFWENCICVIMSVIRTNLSCLPFMMKPSDRMRQKDSHFYQRIQDNQYNIK